MYRCCVLLGLLLLLGGCGWFAPDPSPESGNALPLPQERTTSEQPKQALLPTITVLPSPQPIAAPTTRTPYRLPTPTPTLRPITISLLPLPTQAQVTSVSMQAQQPITGAPLAIQDPAATPTVAAIRPLTMAPTPDGVARSVHVPILMYHYLSDPPTDADIYRRDLSVTPARFAAHLDYLRSAGYTTISLYDLIAALNLGAPLPPRPIILTFDDGYRDSYENAFPLLQAQGMIATFFIVTDFIDEQRPEYLTWDMAREMYAAGMLIESHGRNHVRLRGKDKDYLIWQALGSAETIQAELGVRPHFICYPSGEYDQLTIDIFKSAHYWAGLTTIQGATHSSEDLFELRRVRVRGTTTVAELERLLAVDW